MQYFHTLEKTNGYQGVNDEACNLLKFGKLSLEAGATYEGAVDADRELMLVMLAGKAEVSIRGKTFSIGGRSSVFEGNAHSLYVPRGQGYEVKALTDMEAALPTGPSDLDADPYDIKPEEVQTGQWGTLNYTRYFRKIAVHGDGHPASSLIVGETITPSGNWSTYPPHKHEVNEGGEVFHEEMYYFRNASPDGYGLAQHYSPERGYNDTHLVTDDTLLSMPHGYHTYVAAPGTSSYYLWCLAGDGRAQGTSFDPKVGWVQKTVGMV